MTKKVLTAVIQGAYIQDISARSVNDLVILIFRSLQPARIGNPKTIEPCTDL